MLLRFLILLCFALPLRAQQVDAWDLPPVAYSDTPAADRVIELVGRWASLPDASPLERVRGILKDLRVPEASQVLVFSKTSKQNGLIHPGNPRALYFSSDCYVGYVPGGAVEVAIQDARLGPVFYHIDIGNGTGPVKVERDTSECLSCHATGRTENVPGLLVRSVYPDADGHPLLALGSELVTQQTPIPGRWGGYWVTGSVSLPHLGNRTYEKTDSGEPSVIPLVDLNGKIDPAKYPRLTSDIVALMVLEHQCEAHNLLTAASMNYRRAEHLSKSVNPEADPDQGVAGRVADQAAKKIVDCFLFTGETGQGEDGVEGDEEFQQQFAAAIPRTAAGDSLADFQLNTRLFKYHCSYMVYSEAFRSLPDAVKTRVISRLQKVFLSTTANTHPEIKIPERQRIARILDETGVW
ncbi:hypothetical protein JIN84_12570 [Luteolibacter yonseiensis]|uniref:Cytochrome c domain-containing protein n=1 Tax=Luteolibacter yonseiensis TaxID=1144680 RepID=A0A934R142_9BACT|nr:hypothetical protein [Luteolibacter yonseiensis]MBK1816453.1 hypothetical protein [Luteolibacter yonseiensis]